MGRQSRTARGVRSRGSGSRRLGLLSRHSAHRFYPQGVTGTVPLTWLVKRETLRVSKLWTQTVLAPIISAALFIVVFGFSLGGRIKEIDGVPYKQFIVPGLIVMAMVQAAYSNNSSSVFQARSDKYIHDVLSAPMHP